MLIGLIGTTFATAVFTTVTTSEMQQRHAVADAELRRYSEAVWSAAYVPCAVYDTAAYAFEPSSDAPDVTGGIESGSLKFWSNGSAAAVGVEPEFTERSAVASPCHDKAVEDPADPGLQQLTLWVVVPGSPAVRQQVTIIKRNPNVW